MVMRHIADLELGENESRRFVKPDGRTPLTDSSLVGEILGVIDGAKYTKYRVLVFPYDDSAPARERTPEKTSDSH